MPGDQDFGSLSSKDAALTPASPSPAAAPQAVPAGDAATEARSFGSSDEGLPGSEGPPHRPQADFGAPIDLDPEALGDNQPLDLPDDAPEPTLTGGEIPPLFADADDAAEPRLIDPRPEPPALTVRISQGMPSYSEPEPDIAGVVGRAATGAVGAPHTADPAAPGLKDGGLP